MPTGSAGSGRSSSSIAPRPPSRRRPAGGTAIRASSSASWASPAPTARRRPRSWPRRPSRRPGSPTGLVGTIETRVGGGREPTEHVTTPGAIELQRLLRAMVVAGATGSPSIETTSHGLAAERVAGIAYDAAIFTNLSHEHLEFHGSFEAYRAAKLRLFERLEPASRRKPGRRPPVGIVNRDDPEAGRFAAATLSGRRPARHLRSRPGGRRAGDRASTRTPGGSAWTSRAPGWSGRLALRLAGRFNVHNALAVVALGVGLGARPGGRSGTASRAWPGCPAGWSGSTADSRSGSIVDFAHSPAALESRPRPARPGRRGRAVAGSSPSSGRRGSGTPRSAR